MQDQDCSLGKIAVPNPASDPRNRRRADTPRITRGRAPLRLGLAGGGTDLSPYCQRYGGAILNVTIDRHAYAFISSRDDGKTSFSALDLGQEVSLDAAAAMNEDSTLVLHQGVYRRIVRDFLGGDAAALSIQTTVDAPAGSGLGSSSALVVALVEAFRARYALPLGRYEIAHLAWEIERIDLGLAGGRQDQYAAAFGGVNFIEFLPDDRVIVNPLRLVPGAMEEIEILNCRLLYRSVAQIPRHHRPADERRLHCRQGGRRSDAPTQGRRT